MSCAWHFFSGEIFRTNAEARPAIANSGKNEGKNLGLPPNHLLLFLASHNLGWGHPPLPDLIPDAIKRPRNGHGLAASTFLPRAERLAKGGKWSPLEQWAEGFMGFITDFRNRAGLWVGILPSPGRLRWKYGLALLKETAELSQRGVGEKVF